MAETGRVFFPRTAPLALTGNAVRGLRLSLNTPVVATEELPIGPARAAILVHEDAERGPLLTIGIRALRANRVALYGFEGDLREASSFSVALDAALSFAESMGFLFDEDELGAGGAAARARCLALWQDLLGDDVDSAIPIAPAEPEAAEELLLEDLAEEGVSGDPTDAPVFLSDDDVALPPSDASSGFGGTTDVFVPRFDDGGAGDEAEGGLAGGPLAFEARSGAGEAEVDEGAGLDDETSFADVLDPSDATVAEPPPPPAAASAPAALVSLTKFRTRPASAEAPAAPPAPAGTPVAPAAGEDAAREPRSTALGKLRLVRRLRGGGGRKRHPILRLFGSF